MSSSLLRPRPLILSLLLNLGAAELAWATEKAWRHEVAYTVDAVGALDGAADRSVGVLDNLDMILDGDLEHALGWSGARLHAHVLNNSGDRPNDEIGTLEGIDNIEVSRARLRLLEFWIEQNLGDNASFRAGLYDLNSEFYVTEGSDLLIGPSFGIGSELAATGENGPSIFPSTALAARLRIEGQSGRYVQTAALNAIAGTIGDPGGVNTDFNDGVLLIAEAGLGEGLRAAVGAWRYTEPQHDLRDLNFDLSAAQSRAFGGYVLFEAPLWNTARGAGRAFVRAGVSDGDTSPFSGGWQAGLRIDGVTPGRPDSALSFGARQAHLSDKHRANGQDVGQRLSRAETGLELTYADTFGRVTVQPDLQWIDRPGGDRDAPSALVGALRLSVSLH